MNIPFPSLNDFDPAKASRGKLLKYIDELEFIIQGLLPKNTFIVRLAFAFRLSKSEAITLAFMSDGEVKSKEQLRAVNQAWGYDPSEKTMDQVVFHIRRKCIANGIVIENIYNFGWRIRPDSLAKLKGIKVNDAAPIICSGRKA